MASQPTQLRAATEADISTAWKVFPEGHSRTQAGRRRSLAAVAALLVATVGLCGCGVLYNGTQSNEFYELVALCATNPAATIKAISFSLGNGVASEQIAKCPTNKHAFGGGVIDSGPADGIAVRASGPFGREWRDAADRQRRLPHPVGRLRPQPVGHDQALQGLRALRLTGLLDKSPRAP